MKITEISPKLPGAVVKDREKIQGEVNFSDMLDDAAESTQKTNLKKILADIDRQGMALKSSPTFENLVKYKKLVKLFLDEAVKTVYKRFEDRSWDYRGRHKIYVLIKKTNLKLIELTEAILDKEQPNINLVSKLDEIRGLLIDLYR